MTVGTPSTNNGKINLSYIKKAIEELSKNLKSKQDDHLVVIKSTIIPTTTKELIVPKLKKLQNVFTVYNPEFLREGKAIEDLLKPHLIVIGEETKGGNILFNYYKMFYRKLPKVIRTNFETAEMIKYANNAFLATKVSFINHIANICQNIPGANISTIAEAIGTDPRIGPLNLVAGPGFGGSCLPKDLSALINFSNQFKIEKYFLKIVKQVNDSQPDNIIKLMNQMMPSNNKIVSVLGLAFKKDTDDVRESIAIKLVKKLLKNGVKIQVHDPLALQNFRKIFGNKLSYHVQIQDCLKNSDCCIIMTDCDEFKLLNKNDFQKMKRRNVLDTRRILNYNNLEGVNYKALGIG